MSTMPVKYFDDQFDDEEVLLVFNNHPIVMRKQLIWASIMPVLTLLPVVFIPTLGFGYFFGGLAAGMVLAFFVFFPAWMNWHFSVYIVTNKRFLQRTHKGLFNRSVVDIALDQIRMVNYQVEGLEQTMLGFGTIDIQTYVGELVLKEVHHPREIHRRLTEILKEHKSPAAHLT